MAVKIFLGVFLVLAIFAIAAYADESEVAVSEPAFYQVKTRSGSIYFSNYPSTLEGANFQCLTMNLKLLKIKNADKMEIISTYLRNDITLSSRSYWLAIRRGGISADWTWFDSEPVFYGPIYGQNVNLNDSAIYMCQYTWFSTFVRDVHYFICES